MTRVPSRQRVASWLGASTLALSLGACTSMLGIDGHYVQDDSTGKLTYERDSGGGGASDDGGNLSEGGAETGGAGGSSGNPAGKGDSGVGAAGAGGAPQPDNCKTGLYTGTFTGTHNPAVSFGVKLDIPNGTVSFRLDGATSPLTLSQGKMTGNFAWGKFTAALTGTYECDTGALIAHLHGNLNVVPLSPVIDGDFVGDLLGDPATHKWSEQEAGTSGNVGHGEGTWTATWSKP